VTDTLYSAQTGGKGVPQNLPAAVKKLSESLQFAESKHILGAFACRTSVLIDRDRSIVSFIFKLAAKSTSSIKGLRCVACPSQPFHPTT
jgi:hypothetical protein